ncbi:LOW QUALITY PROTEIN: putative disease resistance protein At3g14460 [Juglans microcarpa x Juglans regia]|uniref:LOW QUALITY PROTEIN: putative disease resistance protein At3g14460 n=1 Tax=Juglans microcarpa x Juglans regia TaxID=2249226 RepID=UPI001B7F2B03|nr:LOW QUALITY PROTEIN: putative disease resistance protein At3g14460 [Juglans microcarpa x Juglans regia]
MAEVVSLLLSPFLQVFFEKVASREFVDFFRSRKLDCRLLKRLEIVLLSANAVLKDAEEMQFTKPMVKKWLDKLKDAVYDAEDILDEIHTEVLRCKLDAEFQTTATKVRKTISTFLNPFAREIKPKIKDVLETLDDLVKQKDAIGLKESVGGKSSGRSSTTSLVKESDIFGRTDDKEAIINLLLSDNVNENGSCVIAIVGMGGLGKTTLAQLVYNDDRMEGHFDHKAWVCVSDDFDVLKMMKTILEKFGLSINSDTKSLDWLQVTLQQNLTGKRFLLVLDDVWNKNYSEWEALSNPFKSGAEGSRVIVTTRERRVASIMHSTAIYDLKTLQNDDCWSLFSKHAFHSGNSNAHPELEVIGRQIVKRCKGLPLAVKTIGALLWSELDIREWNKIMMSEIWDLQSDIIPALRLSYKYLPLHLKRCFAYCSIFPKDYKFNKEELILLWMAEGFLPQGKDKTMEQIGDDYFADLVSRSLFQQSSITYEERFGMNDLVNDLARFVSGQFTFTLEGEDSFEIVQGEVSLEIVNKTRHLSFLTESRGNIEMPGALYMALYVAKGLRTCIRIDSYNDITIDNELMHDLLPILRFLRVLNLSHFENLIELPDSIGKLKHLRHLDVSWTSITKLPNSICKLCNLQTLKISSCLELIVLPRDIHKLICFRHLDFSGTSIKEMPVHLGRLCCLQTLTEFIVGKQSRAGIEELGNLANPGGKLCISNLQNVVSPIHALAASLNDKKYLEELMLKWNDKNNISESQRAVLDNLQPHANLKSLSIIGYGGRSFSDWVRHHSFSNIASLYLFNCKYCSVLPPLGQLPSLQSLSIVHFEGIDAVDRDFYGNCSSSTRPFGALKVLKVRDMPMLEKWFAFGAENEGGAFTHLEELQIRNCPKLSGELPIHPPLSRLVIEKCPLLVTSLSSAATLRQLKLRNCNEALFKQLPTGLQKLAIGGFDALESIPERLMDFNSCLEELEISDGHSLISLSSAGLPSTLKILDIRYCRKLELPMHRIYSSLERLSSHDSFDSLKSFPLNLFPNLTSINLSGCLNLESFNVPQQLELDLVALSSLTIHDCPNFKSFPNGGLRAPKLGKFVVVNCQSVTSLPDKMHILLPSLWRLYLVNCPEVESFPEGGLPSKLRNIYIINCDKLIANRRGWGFQNLPSIQRVGVYGNCKDVESFPEVGLLPTNLVSLDIGNFPNVKSLDCKVTSLDELEIDFCPQLKFMQEEGLPASISTLRINGCDLLDKQLQSRKAWRKIDHIPCIYIGGELI